MDIFARFFATLLSAYYSVTHNYVLSILMLTLTVMIAVLPLTLKATRSMIILQKVTPELKKLQDKYKNDRNKLNEEMMAFYKENRINPLSGCLPILLQAPIFLFLYQALHGLINGGKGEYRPRFLNESSDLYQDLVKSQGKMVENFFGIGHMDFSLRAIGSEHGSLLATVPYFVLIIVMVAAQYYQQRQISSRTPVMTDNPQAQTMRQIQRIMPPAFGIFALTIPAALVLYWAFQSVFRVIQQWAMYRFDPKLKGGVQHAREDAKKHLKESSKPVKRAKELSKESPAQETDALAAPAKAKPKTTKNKSKRKGR